MFRRRTVLVLLLVGAVPAFVLVDALVGRARATREAIALDWAARGAADLAAGRPLTAAEAYRTADEYARAPGAYRLQLAAALVAADRLDEAGAELQTLWNTAPGDGVINLQLARVAARQQRVADAVRYYHTAIDGAWDQDAARSRRAARLELARFLLAHQQRAEAQAELLALASDLPASPAGDADASRLAGEVAFDTGDYPTAKRYLDAAKAAGLDTDGVRMLDLSTRVLGLDPDARGLTARERARRVVRAFDVASASLDGCGAASLDQLRGTRDALQPQIAERDLARDPDALDIAWTFTASAIGAAQTACGDGEGDQRALELILQRRPAS